MEAGLTSGLKEQSRCHHTFKGKHDITLLNLQGDAGCGGGGKGVLS